MSGKKREMQQLPENGPFRTSMPQQTKQKRPKKNQLSGRNKFRRRRRKRTRRNPPNNTNKQNTALQQRPLRCRNDNKRKKQKFIIGSPVTIMPYDQKIHNTKEIKPMKERYQDVNKNEIKFMGKTWVTAEYNGTSTKLPMLITKRNDITPILGVNWLKQLPITINKISLDNETSQSESIYKKYHKLFNTNLTIKDAEVQRQIKPGCYPIQQKARPIPYHLQEDVKNELNRLIESGHLERLETIGEDCFVSPVVITVKKDESVKIALDARKLNYSCIKKRAQMPNKDELLNQISAELSKNDTDPI